MKDVLLAICLGSVTVILVSFAAVTVATILMAALDFFTER